MQEYSLLETGKLPKGATYYHPERPNAHVHLHSPALEVFTDFKSKAPATITAEKTIQTALDEMRITKVKSLIVIDEKEHILGLVSARGIQGLRLGKIAADNDVSLKEVTVGMAMVPCEDMLTLRYEQLERIKVGHVVRLIHDTGYNYILVTEDHPEIAEQTIVRGLFSASRLSRQLGEEVTGDLSAHSLADMNRRIP